ncbi:hypothetical protein RFI_23942 [Reticulomyxa filosa]|uniref:Uncharacterized protein n=1 Tax=Reticulomyxa filosa TaxID=46433 RepID=X6MK56_RETFI|nr:hypothetical protein RFI_23942 [Reticulomyxa filosa]|eukprot:ETO13435.1 hypothetical protein RFI_23942 [Reticulomyxa filosa]
MSSISPIKGQKKELSDFDFEGDCEIEDKSPKKESIRPKSIDYDYKQPTSPETSHSPRGKELIYSNAKSPRTAEGSFILCSSFLSEFESRIQVVPENKVYGNGIRSLVLLYDKFPLVVYSPWLRVKFGTKAFEHKTKKGTSYLLRPVTPDDEEEANQFHIFRQFILKSERFIKEWGINNVEEFFSKEELMNFRDKQIRISDCFQELVRKDKRDGYDLIKISIPVTTVKLKETEVFIEDPVSLEMVHNPKFTPNNLLDIKEGSYIKAMLKYTDLWSNKDKYGATLQTTCELGIKFPPKKVCGLESSKDKIRRQESFKKK